MNLTEQLHDATFLSASIDWSVGRLRLVFKAWTSGPVELALVADGVSSFTCSRLMPWGRSCSVNCVKCVEGSASHHVTIELQSGDSLTVIAATIDLSVN